MTDFYEYFNKMPKSWKVCENQRFEKLRQVLPPASATKTEDQHFAFLPLRLRQNVENYILHV